ncbi:rolling circle replication-associated protein [Actinomycetospora atypica]|uniref:Replication-associated protein ORF2/G2P domain-containing protein n=1 Tax=Actinomycetospora atypica TaxID=1290095 RepID=A0ABV9YSB5_9PSEU
MDPAFPSPELVDAAAAMLPAIREEPGTLAEGRRWELTVGPGVFAVACRDWARRERTEERARAAHVKDIDAAVAAHIATGEWPEPAAPRTAITSWSRKSRANIVRRLCELDYIPLYASGRLPAMVTLTYPGDWLTVVPMGAGLKRRMKALRKRYARTWGEDWACVWKLEFQRRGAPHVHMLCTPPHGRARTRGETFAVWLSAAWADVVDHPDPEQRRRHERAGTALDYAEGLRATDPRRVAAYFTKHGLMASKEYQHHVPPEWSEPGTGPGRFWAVWPLQRAVQTVHVSPEDGIHAGRCGRRRAKAQRRRSRLESSGSIEPPVESATAALSRPPHDQWQPGLGCSADAASSAHSANYAYSRFTSAGDLPTQTGRRMCASRSRAQHLKSRPKTP